MPDFRVVWEFQGPQGETWSELYYCAASNARQAAGVRQATLDARLALLHPLNLLLQTRSSQVDTARVTSIVTHNLAGTAVTVAGPDLAGGSIVCQLTSAIGNTRKIWLRGVPDQYIARSVFNGRDTLDAAVKTLLDTYFTAVKNEGYGTRKLSPKGVGPLENIKILKVDGSALDGTSLITLERAPGFPFPGRVVIGATSKKDLPSLDGHWQLLAAPVGAIIKIPYQTPAGLIFQGGNGYARQEQYSAISIFDPGSCSFHHFGTRTTKKPTTRTRGARRARRIRTSL